MSKLSEVAQVPVVVRGGSIIMENDDLLKLNDKALQLLANTLQGTVAYKKKRIIYTDLEVELCTRHGCYRPAVKDKLTCSDHPA